MEWFYPRLFFRIYQLRKELQYKKITVKPTTEERQARRRWLNKILRCVSKQWWGATFICDKLHSNYYSLMILRDHRLYHRHNRHQERHIELVYISSVQCCWTKGCLFLTFEHKKLREPLTWLDSPSHSFVTLWLVTTLNSTQLNFTQHKFILGREWRSINLFEEKKKKDEDGKDHIVLIWMKALFILVVTSLPIIIIIIITLYI